MKYAIISDIHANLEALEAVVKKCQELGVEKYVCLGDIVGYNANPFECVELVRSLPLLAIVKGNHDEQVSRTDNSSFNNQAAQAITWTYQHLSEEQLEYLKNLPYYIRFGRIMFVHATMEKPQEWGYVLRPHEAVDCIAASGCQITFVGHTHVQEAYDEFPKGEAKHIIIKEEGFTIEPNHRYLVNPGSVGQPRDGIPEAAFATYETEGKKVNFYRINYNREKTKQKILEAGLPDRLAERLDTGH